MIATLKGQVTELGERHVVVETAGLGYKVYVTADALHQLKIDRETKLWTYQAVREDALDLYGFLTKKEEAFFELLLTVSGIGPKSALNILSLVSSETMANAIRTGSTAHLTKVSGLGKKTAEKIVLELKDRLDLALYGGNQSNTDLSSDLDAIEALKALGYEAEEAREALKKVGPEVTATGAKVKAALKNLGK